MANDVQDNLPALVGLVGNQRHDGIAAARASISDASAAVMVRMEERR